jgi:hypothetical protein
MNLTDCHEDDDEEAEGAEERAKRKGQADEEKDRVDSVLAGLGEVLEQVKEVTRYSLKTASHHLCYVEWHYILNHGRPVLFCVSTRNRFAFNSFPLHFLSIFLYVFILPCFPCILLSHFYLPVLHLFLFYSSRIVFVLYCIVF